jgi:hypothetical protein
MSLQTEVDEVGALIMQNLTELTVVDLERGIANAEKWARESVVYRPNRAQKAQHAALRKHAAMLRQELLRRQAAPAVEA